MYSKKIAVEFILFEYNRKRPVRTSQAFFVLSVCMFVFEASAYAAGAFFFLLLICYFGVKFIILELSIFSEDIAYAAGDFLFFKTTCFVRNRCVFELILQTNVQKYAAIG